MQPDPTKRMFVILSFNNQEVQTLGGADIEMIACCKGYPAKPCAILKLDTGERIRGCKFLFGPEGEEDDVIARNWPFAKVTQVPCPPEAVMKDIPVPHGEDPNVVDVETTLHPDAPPPGTLLN